MNRLDDLYLKWLADRVCDTYEKDNYSQLLEHLYSTDFYWKIDMDENVAINGLDLRKQFLDESPAGRRYVQSHEFLSENCTVLEVLVSLSIEFEVKIMSNDGYGDRTGQWFWVMIDNLGLSSSDNRRFNEYLFDEIMEIFLDRRYSDDGKGGLFVINDPKFSAKNVSIWSQAMKSLSEIAKKNREIW